MKTLGIFLLLLCAPILAPAQIIPTAEIPAGEVVAVVDGKNVTAGELRTAIANMPLEFTRLYQQNPQIAVQQMYVMRFLAEEAEKTKLGDKSPLKEQLEALRANVLASAMLTHEQNYFPVSDKMIQDYYEKNKAKYQQSKIKVILVGFKPPVVGAGAALEDIARAASEAAAGKVQRSEADARKLAEDLVKQVRGGADFLKLVPEYSDDPGSKAAAGDFGVVNAASAYSDEIKNAVLALQAGQVTDPIRQPSGFYIIRVEDRTGQTVSQASEPIRQEIRAAHLNEWFTQIRDRFALKVENPRFFTQPAQGQRGASPAPPAVPK